MQAHESLPASYAQSAATPIQISSEEALSRHFNGQLALVAAARGWDRVEVMRWKFGFARGVIDDRDLAASELSGWRYDDMYRRKVAGTDPETRKWFGLEAIAALAVGSTAVGSWSATAATTIGTPVDSNHSTVLQPALPPYRVLNPGDGSLLVGAVAFHINGIASVDISCSGGTWASVTEMSYNAANGGTWAYFAEITEAAATAAGDGGKEIRFHAIPAADGISRVFGNTGATETTEQYRVRLNANGSCPQLKRWSCPTIGNESNDGLDPTGCACTAATFDHTARTLTQTGKFANVDTSIESKRYIYITGGTGFTTGLYYVASKASNDQITLADSADPAGIALFSLPGSSPTNVTSASGPMLYPSTAAIKIGASSGGFGSDNGTVYICAGNTALNRTGTSVTTTYSVCTFRCAPGLTKADVVFTSNTSNYNLSRRIRVYQVTMKAKFRSGFASDTFLWVDDCDIIGATPIERDAGWTPGNYPSGAPTSYTSRFALDEFLLGVWMTGGNYHYMAAGPPSIRTINVNFRYISEGPPSPHLCMNCTVRDLNKLPYGTSTDHGDCIQFSQTLLTNRCVINFRAFGAWAQLIFCRSNELRDIAWVNYLAIHVQLNGHAAKFDAVRPDTGSGESIYRHLLVRHVTLPNVRFDVPNSNGGDGVNFGPMTWYNSSVRYTIQGYITNSIRAADAQMSIRDGHSYETGQKDTTNFAGFTAGDPVFVDGVYNADADSAHEDYAPDVGSPLIARVLGAPIYPADAYGTTMAAAGPNDVGAVQVEDDEDPPPTDPPEPQANADPSGYYYPYYPWSAQPASSFRGS